MQVYINTSIACRMLHVVILLGNVMGLLSKSTSHLRTLLCSGLLVYTVHTYKASGLLLSPSH